MFRISTAGLISICITLVGVCPELARIMKIERHDANLRAMHAELKTPSHVSKATNADQKAFPVVEHEKLFRMQKTVQTLFNKTNKPYSMNRLFSEFFTNLGGVFWGVLESILGHILRVF